MAAEKKRPQRNPSPGILPHIDPDCPVKPMIDAETGEEFTIVSVKLDNGTYVAAVAQVTASGKTRRQAENAASHLYVKHGRRLALRNRRRWSEDEILAAVANKAAKRPHYPLSRLFKRHGRKLEA